MFKEGIWFYLCKNIYFDWIKNRNVLGYVCLRFFKIDNLYNLWNSRWEIYIFVYEYLRKIILMECYILKCYKIYKKLKVNCVNF